MLRGCSRGTLGQNRATVGCTGAALEHKEVLWDKRGFFRSVVGVLWDILGHFWMRGTHFKNFGRRKGPSGPLGTLRGGRGAVPGAEPGRSPLPARSISAPSPLPSRSHPAAGPAPRPPPGSILFAAAAEPLQVRGGAGEIGGIREGRRDPPRELGGDLPPGTPTAIPQPPRDPRRCRGPQGAIPSHKAVPASPRDPQLGTPGVTPRARRDPISTSPRPPATGAVRDREPPAATPPDPSRQTPPEPSSSSDPPHAPPTHTPQTLTESPGPTKQQSPHHQIRTGPTQRLVLPHRTSRHPLAAPTPPSPRPSQ